MPVLLFARNSVKTTLIEICTQRLQINIVVTRHPCSRLAGGAISTTYLPYTYMPYTMRIGKQSNPMETLPKPDKTIVLVGLMGAGKSTIGRRLAALLDLPFADSDQEIEEAAGMSVSEIFETLGEAEFRRGEKRVIERLVNGPQCVLATGGGAFVDPDSRALIKEKCISIWLRADLDVLMRRVAKRPMRPLLQADHPETVMKKLMAERDPFYRTADLAVDSLDGPHQTTVDEILRGLDRICKKHNASDAHARRGDDKEWVPDDLD